MVIQYKSKGKVDRVREEGFIYLDIANNAVSKSDRRQLFDSNVESALCYL
ncbi:MAG: hypothetical protein IPM91_00020 [Bacteroidetes bacterium]|nr:hypothetical protein [Bacteroidota bacterium]